MSNFPLPSPEILSLLRDGQVIPAHPLALTADRTLDERRQRVLTRYYLDAGAGGIAVGVHTTQFAIRDVGLFEPVLELAASTAREWEARSGRRVVKVAGAVGPTASALKDVRIARDLGYDLVLLNLAALRDADDDALIAHCRAVAEVMPLFGFYLQASVGGRVLSRSFWRRFAEIPNVAAIKIAPFNRYQTLDVIRAVAESGRAGDVALYTGNDDHILLDLLATYRIQGPNSGPSLEIPITGGLLGHWAVWTRRAVEQLERVKALRASGQPIPPDLLILANEITDSNAAFFDPEHGYAGCIAGLHEVLRRQGLLEGTWCLDPREGLSPGQAEEIDRVYAAYPHLHDDDFVREHLDGWLK